MKKSVGLLVMTEFDGILHAILHRRGVWNHDKDRRQHWAGAYQVTAHGGIKLDEQVETVTLLREAGEELGTETALMIAIVMADGRKVPKINEHRTDEEEVTTFAIGLRSSFLKKVKLNASSGGLLPISINNLNKLVPIKPEWKEQNPPENVIAMFENDIRAVRSTNTPFRL